MNHIHFVRRTASAVFVLCSSFLGLALFAPSAFALMIGFRSYASGQLPLGGAQPGLAQPHQTVVHAVVAQGMAGWLITLIAVGAALLAATAAVFRDRARASHRSLAVPAT
jgi:hypothetical protein